MLFVAWLAGAARAAPPSDSRETRAAALRENLSKEIELLRVSLQKPDPQPPTRYLTACAHDLLAMNPSSSDTTAQAQGLLQQAFDQQNMNPSSPDFGTVPWQIGHPEIHDANAIEFTASPLGPIFLLHSDELTASFKAAAIPHLEAAVAAIQHHKVDITYTNIYLMKAANLHLIGLALHDASVAGQGAQLFRDWFAFTRSAGITEFNSPTYAATQLTCLLQAYRATTDLPLKQQLKAALDYLWTDIAANTFLHKSGGAQLAGAFSRNYDFLDGDGPVDRYLYLEGLRDTPPAATLFVDLAGPLLNDLEHGYTPGRSILALPALPERLVLARAGTQPGQDRTSYLTADFAIGSASCFHGPQDRQLSLSLANDPTTSRQCDLSVVLDSFDAPFGKLQHKDGSGHPKPTHLRNAIVSVQEKGMVLALLEFVPSKEPEVVSSIATNILFPANADELLLDGRPLRLAPDAVVPVSPDSWLIVRQGHAAAAVRLFAATASSRQDPSAARWFIKYDAPELRTGRLVAYHYNGTHAVPVEKSLRAGILMLARHVDGPADASDWAVDLRRTSVSESLTDSEWTASFSTPAAMLGASLDLVHHRPLHRLIDGNEIRAVPFTLNGEDQTSSLPRPTP